MQDNIDNATSKVNNMIGAGGGQKDNATTNNDNGND